MLTTTHIELYTIYKYNKTNDIGNLKPAQIQYHIGCFLTKTLKIPAGIPALKPNDQLV